MPYNDTWRARRRVLHQNLHEKAAAIHEPTQRVKAREFLTMVHESPEHVFDHLKR